MNSSNSAVLPQPPTFDYEASDVSKQFSAFQRYCKLLLSVAPYKDQSDEEKVNLILLWMGIRGVEIFDNLTTLSDEERKNPTKVWDAFTTYFEPKSNFRLARFEFRSMMQATDETTDSYITRLRTQAKQCKWTADDTNDNLIDQLIKGTRHNAVRRHILDANPETLSLTQAIEYGRRHEATTAHLQRFEAQDQQPALSSNSTVEESDVAAIRQHNRHRQCMFCGKEQHQRSACPARQSQCSYCNKQGHWAQVCRKRKSSTQKHKAVHNIEQPQYDSDDVEHLSFNAIDNDAPSNQSEAYTTITFKPYQNQCASLEGKIDTGAQSNVLPLRTYKNIYPEAIDNKGLPMNTKHSYTRLTAYNGTNIPQYGTVTLTCKKNEKWYNEEFYVADTPGPVIFGLPTCTKLGLVSINCLVNLDTKQLGNLPSIKSSEDLRQLYPDRFEGIGKLPGKHCIPIDKSVPPIKHAPRRTPIQLKQAIDSGLEAMESLGVIRRVNEPTNWVSSLVYPPKANGDVRICLDPKDLNDALIRNPHPLPTLEQVSHKLCGAQVISKLDIKNSYWCVQLDNDSQLLTTFNSPLGRFCFQRLPFGLKSSQDIFQNALDSALGGLPGVIAMCDDIIVFGSSIKEHDKNLHQLMLRARDKGIVFNYNKCSINQPEISFFGHVYTKNGIKPDPKKVQAIHDLVEPSNCSELQSFLGLITYLSPFIKNLSEQTSVLRNLLKQGVDFNWLPEHRSAFRQIKTLISDDALLAYFDPKLETVIEVDASQHALGACLMQNNRPIAYASKSLTPAETRYANIEREMLACVFGAERFHLYIYGAPFVIRSDHKPLETICQKPLTSAPPRLQRMLLELQKYDYKITYKPGRAMIPADALSRLPKRTADPPIPLDITVNFVQFSQSALSKLKDSTALDPALGELLQVICKGFPEHQHQVSSLLRPYWCFRDQLSIEDGLVIMGQRIVIPEELRPYYLSKIHEGHQGTTRCQQRARTCIYWPGINKDIQNCVEQCQKCQCFQQSQPREPLQSMCNDFPNIPWYTLGIDIMFHNQTTYLVIVDYFSKYPIVEMLSNCSSYAVSRIVNKYIGLFGRPYQIISDNGPQFIGSAFQKLIKDFNIIHTTSSPHYPRSHGMVERTIRTVRSILNKNRDLDSALLIYRSTPADSHTPSPGEMFLNRKLASGLPLCSSTQIPDTFRLSQQNKREKSENTYNSGTKSLPDLHVNQPVWIQDPAKRSWFPGCIVGVGPEPRSYCVSCDCTGRLLRRNRQLLRPRVVLKHTQQADQHIAQSNDNTGTSTAPQQQSDSNQQTNRSVPVTQSAQTPANLDTQDTSAALPVPRRSNRARHAPDYYQAGFS